MAFIYESFFNTESLNERAPHFKLKANYKHNMWTYFSRECK